ncbi:unnamed protein product [Hymenolepis diminuta]|uniref:Uncharacterized protein n=1 Tax=Hymenolepis diminuta TaxID=6216 RepID=A0A0R3SZN7_HYMDI|nr:unnamed protein product [Hymenolepis diminuta]
MLLNRPIQLTLLYDRYKQSDETDLAKPLPLTNGTMSKVLGENAVEAAFSYHQHLMPSQIKCLWFHIVPTLAESIQSTSLLIPWRHHSQSGLGLCSLSLPQPMAPPPPPQVILSPRRIRVDPTL